MRWRVGIAFLVGLVVVAGSVALLVRYFRSAPTVTSPWIVEAGHAAPRTRPVALFFGDPAAPELVRESREILDDPALADRIERLVTELLRGSSAGNVSLFDRRCRVRSVFLSDDALVIDLQGMPFAREAGDTTRWLAIRALVESITINVAEVSTLTLLVDGEPLSSREPRLALSDVIVLRDLAPDEIG